MKANYLQYTFKLIESPSYIYGDPNNDKCFVLDLRILKTNIDAIFNQLKLSSATDWQSYLNNVFVFWQKWLNDGKWGNKSMFSAESDEDGKLTGTFHFWIDADVVKPMGISLYDQYDEFRVIAMGKTNGVNDYDGIQYTDLPSLKPYSCTVIPKLS